MPVIKDEKVKNNPWYYVIEIGRGKDRKRQKKRGFKTKKDAEKAMVAVQNDLNKGIYIEPSKEVYRDFMRDWLNDKKTKVKRGTLGVYTSLVYKHILPALGDIVISKITPRDIQNFYNSLHDSCQLCGENIQKVHTIIKGSLNKATEWDMIIKNPAFVVERPKAEAVEMLYWEDWESHLFLNTAKSFRYYHAFLLGITTGMRQGEILGLKWKDIDFQNRTVSIRQTLSHDGKRIEFGTKTKSGMRMVGIDKVTADELKLLQSRTNEEKLAEQDIYNNQSLVICTQLGTPLNPRNLNRSFKSIINLINERLEKNAKEPNEEPQQLKKIRFHDLRHTHVVMLLKMRENSKRIVERMGWASVRMIDRYAHIMPSMQQDTADAFGDMFFLNK